MSILRRFFSQTKIEIIRRNSIQITILIKCISFRRSKGEDNTQSDNNSGTMQSAKEEKDISEDDNDESNNMKINDECNFDLDEIVSTEIFVYFIRLYSF